MRPPGLTVTIVAQDEADRVGDAVASARFADEVLVVDGGSRDRTREVAEMAGARVVSNPWPGYAAQKNHAADLARFRWVLGLDADERVTARLAAEVRAAVDGDAARGGPAAYAVRRRMIYLGREMRGCGFWPDWRVRLVREGAGRWEGDDPHDRLVASGPVGRLYGELTHVSYRDLSDHWRRIDRHAGDRARTAFARGRRASALDLWLRPPAFFLSRYLLRRGFLDGWRGLVACGLGAAYVFLRFARLKALEAGGEDPRG